MSNVPNYRSLSPPDDKPTEEYTWAERRSEIYDLIEKAGHYRNIEASQRELGRRYGVSHSQIREDIQAINEWTAEHLGDNAEAELESLKTTAVQHLIEQGKPDKAYYLMMNHYETLMDAKAASQEKEPEKNETDLTVEGKDWSEQMDAAIEGGEVDLKDYQ